MTDILFLVLLVFHITAIVAWMGGGVLFVSVVTPSLRDMSPSSRSEFIRSTIPRYFRFITGSSITAIIAGLLLYGYIAQAGPPLALTVSGAIYVQTGAVLGLIALIFVLGFAMPAGRKLVSLMSQTAKASSENMEGQIASLQRRLAMGARLGVVLLAITLVLMVLGVEL
jgi:uncharacterized membrane protein